MVAAWTEPQAARTTAGAAAAEPEAAAAAQSRTEKGCTGSKRSMAERLAEAVAVVSAAAAAAATGRMATEKTETAWYSHVGAGVGQKTAWRSAASIIG